MKKKNAILLLLICAFAAASIALIIYSLYMVIGVKNIGIEFTVGDHIGINTQSDKLWMGMTTPGGSSARKTLLENEHNSPVLIKMIVLGEIKQYVSLSENNFILQPKEQKELTVNVNTPKGIPYGNYTGTLRVITKRACALFC